MIKTKALFLSLGLMALSSTAMAQPPEGGHERRMHSPEEIMERLDTNKDGFIDKSEAKGMLAKNFDEIDTNHDGKISLDELKAAFETMRKNHQDQPPHDQPPADQPK